VNHKRVARLMREDNLVGTELQLSLDNLTGQRDHGEIYANLTNWDSMVSQNCHEKNCLKRDSPDRCWEWCRGQKSSVTSVVEVISCPSDWYRETLIVTGLAAFRTPDP
jgi:hypothetical protein